MQQDSPVAISPEKWRETFGIVATVSPFCFPFLPIFFFLLFNSRVQVILCFMHGTSAPSTFVSSSPLAEIWVQPKEFPTATHIQYLSVWALPHLIFLPMQVLFLQPVNDSLLPPTLNTTPISSANRAVLQQDPEILTNNQSLPWSSKTLASHEEHGLLELSSWAELADSELLGDIHLWTTSHCPRLLFTFAKLCSLKQANVTSSSSCSHVAGQNGFLYSNKPCHSVAAWK